MAKQVQYTIASRIWLALKLAILGLILSLATGLLMRSWTFADPATAMKLGSVVTLALLTTLFIIRPILRGSKNGMFAGVDNIVVTIFVASVVYICIAAVWILVATVWSFARANGAWTESFFLLTNTEDLRNVVSELAMNYLIAIVLAALFGGLESWFYRNGSYSSSKPDE